MPDNLTPEQRSYAMSRVPSTDTSLERRVRAVAFARGLRFRKHSKDLPGRPDLAFRKARVVVFIDGDFWHGYRFSLWRHKLKPYWEAKIERNRKRDQGNFRRLRRSGWTVVRIWGHEVDQDVERCVDRIKSAIESSLKNARYASVRSNSSAKS